MLSKFSLKKFHIGGCVPSAGIRLRICEAKLYSLKLDCISN